MMELANQFKLPVVDFSSYHQCEDNPSEEQIQTEYKQYHKTKGDKHLK